MNMQSQWEQREGAGVRARGKRSHGGRLHNYLLRHLQTFFYSLGQLSGRPVATLMTAAVIGVSLALPAGLHVLLKNVQHVLSGWDGAAQVSVFMQPKVPEAAILAFAGELRGDLGIASVDYISREQALNEFRELSGFGEALDALEENPLPAVLVVRPTLVHSGPQQMASLVERLQAKPQVELARLDMDWVKRLHALMEIGRRGVWVLAALLSLAVLLVVGNTIRLAIQNRRDEIVVTKLIGGTDAFIRRPFLYSGFWYGLFGGIISFLLVQGSLLLLAEPVHRLAGLYGSGFRLTSLDATTTTLLLLCGTLLGLFGSWLAVGRHLQSIEPT